MAGGDVPYTDLPIYREQLASALGFEEPDLDANRSGELGNRQRRTIGRRLAYTAVGVVFVLVLAVLFAWIGVAGNALLPALVGVALCLTAGGYFGWSGIRLGLDARGGTVASVEGQVQPAEQETRIPAGRFPGVKASVWSYYWSVGGSARFAVPGRAYAVLLPSWHRIYYLPRSRLVVAVEPVLHSPLAG